MMSQIYKISAIKGKPGQQTISPPVRFVRAKTKAGAIRAFAEEGFHAEMAKAEDIVTASQGSNFSVLDALEDDKDPGPVPGGEA
jgi:hypothetical protein